MSSHKHTPESIEKIRIAQLKAQALKRGETAVEDDVEETNHNTVPLEPYSRDANATSRAEHAIQLRRQRLSYTEVAARSGYASAGAAYNAIQRELERTVVTAVDDLRREEIDMLDRLHAEVWPLAMDPTYKGRLFAVDRILAISDARRKLMGMDVPVNANVFSAQVVVREVPNGYLGEEPKA